MPQKRTREATGAFELLLYLMLIVGLDAIPLVTFMAVFGQACVYLRLFSLPWSDPLEACIGVDVVLFKGDWQRIFYGAIEHGDSMHLYYNMTSFVWKGINIEKKVGSAQFAWILFLLTTVTGVLMVALYYLLGTYVDAIFYSRCSIGFSGVIFALKVLDNVLYPEQSRNLFGLHVTLPSGLIVWLELILVQVMAGNNCSFVGHLAGVLAGFIYIGMLTPIYNVTWLALVEAPRSVVERFCPRLTLVPCGAILLSAASLAANADYLPTAELKLQALDRLNWTSPAVIDEGQWHLLLVQMLRCSGPLHLAYTVATLLDLGYRLERKVGTARFLVDTAILAAVANAAYCVTTHYVLPNYDEIAGVSPAEMRHNCFAGPTATLFALKAFYGGDPWLRKYPLLFVSVPLPSIVGAILEIDLLYFALPDLWIVAHAVGFLVGLLMSFVLPEP
ncbi:hypothetical protein HPB50_000281 [Hyalomma asiaticum]|uniref:Uncharacterized protein n=1 Tax=Hyalomma asiaticum TaxID=266040 RepID=A0ACB7S6U2_HYAAI|nr:hypothetical protein HPB50_000281 [Hyalomma asiaticum]